MKFCMEIVSILTDYVGILLVSKRTYKVCRIIACKSAYLQIV